MRPRPDLRPLPPDGELAAALRRFAEALARIAARRAEAMAQQVGLEAAAGPAPCRPCSGLRLPLVPRGCRSCRCGATAPSSRT